MTGVIAVFAVPGPIWIGPQRQRTLGPFWWFVLSNTYALTALAIALVLGLSWLRQPRVGSAVLVVRRN